MEMAKTLELRDRETDGHSQRVIELTVELARAYGVNGKEIIHIRRGALLHDIGKMGIHYSILLKPGPLDETEWEIMRTHPLAGMPSRKKRSSIIYVNKRGNILIRR